MDVLHTVHPEFLEALITHAAEQRNTANGANQQKQSIEISQEMWDKLNQIPFKSSKFIIANSYF